MTRDEILNMEAGREMDELVAEKVMGHKWPNDRCPICGWKYASSIEKGCVPGNCSERPAPQQRADTSPPYSDDISAAWEVVEKLEGKDIWFDASSLIPNSDPVVYDFAFHGVGLHNAHACEDTLPLAICRAALLAVME